MYGYGDCREFNYCSRRGTCVDGKCVCPPQYLDANCSIKIDCKYWDEELQAWSTEGVVTSLATDGSANAQCATTHLTTFGGVLTIPTSVEELTAELKQVILHRDELIALPQFFLYTTLSHESLTAQGCPRPHASLSCAQAFTFTTFSLDEASSLLSNFNLSDNVTVVVTMIILVSLNLVTLVWLGYYRGRRERIVRFRSNKITEEEAVELDLRKSLDLQRRIAKSTFHCNSLQWEKSSIGEAVDAGRTGGAESHDRGADDVSVRKQLPANDEPTAHDDGVPVLLLSDDQVEIQTSPCIDVISQAPVGRLANSRPPSRLAWPTKEQTMPQTQFTPEGRVATPLTPQHIPRRRTTAAPASWNCHSPRSPPRVAPRVAPRAASRALSPPTSPPGNDGDDNELHRQKSKLKRSEVLRMKQKQLQHLQQSRHQLRKERTSAIADIPADAPAQASYAQAVIARMRACLGAIRAFLGRLLGNFRSEHTLISFLAPGSDEDSLTRVQIVQVASAPSPSDSSAFPPCLPRFYCLAC